MTHPQPKPREKPKPSKQPARALARAPSAKPLAAPREKPQAPTAPNAKALTALLARLREKHPQATQAQRRSSVPKGFLRADPLLAEVLASLVLWECATADAIDAMKVLHKELADANELRVCQADEIAAMLGPRVALASEKGRRIRTVLGSIFTTHPALSLAPLELLPRRDARAAVEAIADLPAYAAQRACLVRLGVNAVPMEERVRTLLAAEKIIPAHFDAEQASNWLERRITGEEYLAVHELLRAWADDHGTLPHAPERAAPHANKPSAVPVRGAVAAKIRGKNAKYPAQEA